MSILVVIAGTLTISGTASADLGVGVGANPLELSRTARPGNSYRLPPLTVVNTGTQAARYHLRIQRLSTKSPAATIPPDWITFSDDGFSLTPNARTSVVLTVTVPTSARPGTYTSDVIATGALPNDRSQAATGAAAAAAINFTVTKTASNGSSDPSDIWLALVGVLALAALTLLVWRSGIRVKVERR